ncbi:hypothetical protein GIB67_037799 [Kingdonia uniflora]|uniref:Uncharacterized protein n=1 Tax=Kingdonia uniflora TaxID=39325 RepID=A0A7J7LV90_9MAGN|nr:hypothetical protein GIB67_037799 [Kingdonia uniflora]
MDAYEATRAVFSRIQSLDPENASKIMGLLLIQDHGEKEMIRLAFGPESLLHSVMFKARKDLGLANNSLNSPSSPSSPSLPFYPNNPISRQNSSSSRMFSNLSPSSSSWVPSNFSDFQNLDDFTNNNSISTPSDLIDDFQLQDHLSFLNENTPKNSDLFYPPLSPQLPPDSPGSSSDGGMIFPPYGANWSNNHHRRSCSVTDICMGSDPLGSGLGWKPCLYFARGYCKNGTSCRFLHGLPDSSDVSSMVGSPGGKLDVMEQCQELLLRSKSQQQQQLRSQLLGSPTFPYSSSTSSVGKCMNFLLQQQQNDTQRAAAAAAMMLGEDVHKFNRSRMERNDFASLGGAGMVNPGSRQIYLTFPADSTFREEDVSNYFSIYGPVQDVRIPYQQKRMFGFVTFVYAETVKLILAKGNPHFVCDARVLVKPYKEKGKVPDKKVQQSERGEFSACTTPTGLDPRDPFDMGGPRMFNSTHQDMILRRKLEEAELQQALELQSRRLMGLQLLDIKKLHHHQRNMSSGSAPICSPHSPHMNHNLIVPPSSSSDRSSPDSPSPQEICGSPPSIIVEKNVMNDEKEEFPNSNNHDDSDFHNSSNSNNIINSLEHNLPDSPFASPTKSGGDNHPFFTTITSETDKMSLSSSSSSTSTTNNSLIPSSSSLLPTAATSTLDISSYKSCFFPITRFSSGHGAIGM